MKSRLNTEKTLCYSELSGHTSRPDIKKSKSHALFSLLNPWSNEGCFFVRHCCKVSDEAAF
ncbi:hypothetical protein CNN69_08270, partial [Escherichia coli]